jgi:hypothetical protein
MDQGRKTRKKKLKKKLKKQKRFIGSLNAFKLLPKQFRMSALQKKSGGGNINIGKGVTKH